MLSRPEPYRQVDLSIMLEISIPSACDASRQTPTLQDDGARIRPHVLRSSHTAILLHQSTPAQWKMPTGVLLGYDLDMPQFKDSHGYFGELV
jgi:hypothetical protein